ncbi:outer membrane lipoprotein-sorting protein [Pseudomonadales bacterium]|nr:outer membrane lipoprotein-sorting protein [Pseudomonadales bacterium]
MRLIHCLLLCCLGATNAFAADYPQGVKGQDAAQASAPDAEIQSAEQLIDQMEALYRQESSTFTLSMAIKTPDYQRQLTLVGASQGQDYSYFRILAPKKDRGVATLKRENEMWNYLPKINRIIKVPPSMMMNAWMGSDFTNDDLVKQTTLSEAYTLSLVSLADTYEVTLIPKEETVTVWGRIVYTVLKSPLIPQGQTYFDDKGVAVRTLTFSEPRLFGSLILPAKLVMTPLNKKGFETVIVYEDLTVNDPSITAETFSLRALKRRF